MALRLDQKTRLLMALPVFQVMEPEAVHVLAFSTRERPVRAGETLFRRGDASDGGFIVLSGSVTLTGGSEAKTLSPGALIGEAALVAETERPATAIAAEDGSLLVIPRALVHQVLEAHPASAMHLREHVAGLVAATQSAIRKLSV